MNNATYSPEDNKLRLYPSSRLPRDLYERVRAAGFKWAPKQGLFVAPTWTPDREDLLLELCDEIADEDKTLTERAEERADRFEDYSDKRATDAERARQAVHAIADGIPLGQPILIGHHSEKHARRDAKRIEDGMRRAVNLWKTSEYWTQRAAGALRHAKYKERPDVRARRIKGIEADKRKREREREKSARLLELFERADAFAIKAYDDGGLVAALLATHSGGLSWEDSTKFERGEIPLEEAHARALANVRAGVAWCNRWIEHYENRLAYERAMLADAGGTVTDKTAPEHGGACRCLYSPRGGWSYIVKVNRVSVSILDNWGNGGANFARTIPLDDLSAIMTAAQVNDARAAGMLRDVDNGLGFYLLDTPAPDLIGTPAPASLATKNKMGQLCNYPGAGAVEITAAQWDAIPKDYRRFSRVEGNGDVGLHRVRKALGVYVFPGERDANKRHSWPRVYITDAKRIDAPPATVAGKRAAEPAPVPAPAPAPAPVPQPTRQPQRQGADFEAMAHALKAGVHVVTAPQLFPTPPDLAARVVDLAAIEPGQCVLEPSGGTGRLIDAVISAGIDTEILTYEVDARLCATLRARFPSYRVQVRERDFLTVEDFKGHYPRVIMNPPFSNGADIAHIKHALEFVAPGGRLVAICANGPRQAEALKPLADEWLDLPPGAFKESGTNVNAAVLVINKPA